MLLYICAVLYFTFVRYFTLHFCDKKEEKEDFLIKQLIFVRYFSLLLYNNQRKEEMYEKRRCSFDL